MKELHISKFLQQPDIRRKGIALHTLELLVQEAGGGEITHITLEATEMGRPLYEKYGFVKMEDGMEDEMELPGGDAGRCVHRGNRKEIFIDIPCVYR